MIIRIVHLSDFHLINEKMKETKQKIVNELIKDLIDVGVEKAIDFIFYTGDLIDRGGKSFESIDKAFDCFYEIGVLPLSVELNIPKEHFIFVPGNHDIQEDDDCMLCINTRKESLLNTDSLDKYVNDVLFKGNTNGIKRILPYKEFEKRVHSENLDNITSLHSCYMFDLEGLSLGVAAFNTSWTCNSSDKDNRLLFGEKQITEANEKLGTCDIKIALMHHSLDELDILERELITNLINKDYKIQLSGHVHKNDTYSKKDIFISVGFKNSESGSKDDSILYSNGYSIIDIDTTNNKIIVNKRVYRNLEYCKEGQCEEFPIIINSISNKAEMPIKENFNRHEIDLLQNIRKETSAFQANNREILIKNKGNKYPFYRNLEKINKCIYAVFGQKTLKMEDETSCDIEEIVVLMDRFLYLLKEDDFYEKAKLIISNLEILLKDELDDITHIQIIDEIYAVMKWWLQRITAHLCDGPIKDEFGDLIKTYLQGNLPSTLIQLIRKNGYIYDCIQTENVYELRSIKSNHLLTQIILGYMLPFIKHKDKVSLITKGLIIDDENNQEINLLIKSMVDEYQIDMNCFIGREKNIEELRNSIQINKCTILKGLDKVGKSAIIAKLISQWDYLQPLIIHSFKQSKNMNDTFFSLIYQCNRMIINKIEIEDFHNAFIGLSYDAFDDEDNIYFQYLVVVIERVIKECGELFIIFDSVENAEYFVKIIKQLLSNIPSQCHLVIATTDDEVYADDASYVLVNNLTREEVENSFNYLDTDVIKMLYAKTKGRVADIKRIVEENKGNIKREDVEKFSEYVYGDKKLDELADIWIQNNILEECLILLSIFAPIQPVSLANIQGFLNYKKIKCRMPIIRNELKKIGNQISELRFNRVVLLDKEFVEYVVDYYFSVNDIYDAYVDILSWISKDNSVDEEIIGDLFKYMFTSNKVRKEQLDKYIEIYINLFSDVEHSKQILYVGLKLFRDVSDDEDMVNILRFIEKAHQMSYAEATAFMGFIYMKGKRVKKDIAKAEEFLVDASKQGNENAKLILSDYYFEIGRANDAECLLEEAILLGCDKAKLRLAINYLIGSDLNITNAKGKEMLFQLANKDNKDALRILGKFYLEGTFFERNVAVGIEFIERAMDLGDQQSKLLYAKYLFKHADKSEQAIVVLKDLVKEGFIDAKLYYSILHIKGDYSFSDINEGINILLELVEQGVVRAIKEYAEMLIEGNHITQDIEKGKELLYTLILKDDTLAMIILGNYLIDGEYISLDIEEGLNLFEKACELNDEDALRILGMRFSYGIGVEKNVEKGIELLRRSIKEGSSLAKVNYVKVIINNSKLVVVERNEVQKLLEETIRFGETSGMVLMANLLFEGNVIDKNISRAKRLLEIAVEMGDVSAIQQLGYRCLTGNGVYQDTIMAKEFLERAIRLGDELSCTILGEAIVNRKIIDNIDKGVELLESVASVEINASRILGLMYIKGRSVDKNIEKGLALLHKAADSENEDALLDLAVMLIDGNYLQQNKEEGRRIIENLIDRGNWEAKIVLANRMIKADGIEKDISSGVKYFEELISQGNLEATCEFAIHLIMEKDPSIANKNRGEVLLNKAAELGHKKSKFTRGRLMLERVIEGGEEKAREIINDCCNDGDENAIRYYANYILKESKVDRDIKLAVQLFDQLVSKNDLQGITEYAEILISGIQMDKDVARGMYYLNEAVCQGNRYSRYVYADILIEGRVVNQELEKGEKMMTLLVDEGYKIAKRYLANKYALGEKLERNIVKAVELFESLCAENDRVGILAYARLLLDGRYILRDSVKAEKMLKKLSSEGDQEAIHILSERYHDGYGLKKHMSKARKYFDKENGISDPELMFEHALRIKRDSKAPLKGRTQQQFGKRESMINEAIERADIDDLHSMGMVAYKKKEFQLATTLFVKAYKLGSTESGVSLAYMKRRSEIRDTEFEIPLFDILLEKALANNEEVAIINKALMMVQKSTNDYDWKEADKLIRNLKRCTGEVEWWYTLAEEENDLEGMLVIGWLEKYNLVYTKENNYKERFQKVKDGGCYLPDWLIYSVDSKSMISEEPIAATNEDGN